tara:strand:+ start:412 stop:678 length:267 start_codon:yes stop_codon:yes gene_type:complete
MKTLADQLHDESVYGDIMFIKDQVMGDTPNFEAVVRVANRLDWENHDDFANLMHAVEKLEDAMGAMADKCHMAIEKMEANGFVYGKLG